MKKLENLIEKWELELHYYTAAYGTDDVSEISNDVDRSKAILIKDVLSDLNKLLEKLKEHQGEVRSVSSHQDEERNCDSCLFTQLPKSKGICLECDDDYSKWEQVTSSDRNQGEDDEKICRHCGKYKHLQGNGIIHQLCMCSTSGQI